MDVMSVSYLRSCILRVMTWWTSCSMSATVASGASVTQDRGTGFHLPTWMRPEHKRESCEQKQATPYRPSVPRCVSRTFGLCSRAVRVAQCQQGHLYQLVKQQVSLDQHELCVFFSPLSLRGTFLVLHHTEHGQQARWGDSKDMLSDAWEPQWQQCDITTFQPIVPLLCKLLLCGLAAGGFWARLGFLATGLPWLLLSWVEGPAPFCSSRASLAGGGRGSTRGSQPSGFLAPLHRASIWGITLTESRLLQIK